MHIRYPLSLRQVEDILVERDTNTSHGIGRFRCNRFGPLLAGEIRKQRIRRQSYSLWRWHVDEVFVTDRLASYGAAAPASRDQAPPEVGPLVQQQGRKIAAAGCVNNRLSRSIRDILRSVRHRPIDYWRRSSTPSSFHIHSKL